MMHTKTVAALVAVAASQCVNAITLEPANQDSMKSAAQQAASGVASLYQESTGQSGIPGQLGQGYPWWEGGLALDSLLRYWAATGDSQYNDMITRDLFWQKGDNNDFAPANRSQDLITGGQALWASAALTAAEYMFPEPQDGQGTWQQLAENSFTVQAMRWDVTTCSGGLRSQPFDYQPGFGYKDASSNAAFLQLAARLYRLTDQQVYKDWAEKSYMWMRAVNFIDMEGNVFAGAPVEGGCSQVDQIQWSSDAGLAAYGASIMAGKTNNKEWVGGSTALVNKALQVFAPNAIIAEPTCLDLANCHPEQFPLKGIYTRFMGATSAATPPVRNLIQAPLAMSAKGASLACAQPGLNGSACGYTWTDPFDNTTGLGQQMNALDVFTAVIMATGEKVVKTSATPTDSAVPVDPMATGDGQPAGNQTAPTVPAEPPAPTPSDSAASSYMQSGALGGFALAAVAALFNLL